MEAFWLNSRKLEGAGEEAGGDDRRIRDGKKKTSFIEPRDQMTVLHPEPFSCIKKKKGFMFGAIKKQKNTVQRAFRKNIIITTSICNQPYQD